MSPTIKNVLSIQSAGHLVRQSLQTPIVVTPNHRGLIAASLLIIVGLIGHRDAMAAVMPLKAWFVLTTLLSPIGYVIQDVVADAMTVEAVPKVDDAGLPIPEAQQKLMHTTMQTLGRVAIIGGLTLVSLVIKTSK